MNTQNIIDTIVELTKAGLSTVEVGLELKRMGVKLTVELTSADLNAVVGTHYNNIGE